MIAWFCQNRVASTALMVFIVLSGLFALQFIATDAYPQYDPEEIQVQVSYPGSSPETAEQGVTTHIEDALEGITDVEKIDSFSSEGSVFVRVRLKSQVDYDRVFNEVKTRVDAINTLPAGADRPVVQFRDYRNKKITTLIVYADDISETELYAQSKQLRNELRELPGIGIVEVLYDKQQEIAIEISSIALAEHNLTIRDISNALNQNAIDVSAGNLRTKSGDVIIQTRAQAYNKEAIENVVIAKSSEGHELTIKTIAKVTEGFELSNNKMLINGKPGIAITVESAGVQNIVDLSDRIATYIEERQHTLPQGVYITEWANRSLWVKGRLDSLFKNALQGGLLVLIVLGLFLRPSVALWVVAGIPVSVIGCFISMALFGEGFNTITVLAFILVLGIVVDDAIVTAEHVYTRLTENPDAPKVDTVVAATKEIAQPVTLGVVTTIIAFAPLVFLPGNGNVMFRAIPAIVIPILVFSLIESKFILPSHLKSIRMQSHDQPSFWERIPNKVTFWVQYFAQNYYGRFLRYCMSAKTLVMFVFVCTALLTWLSVSEGHVRYQSMPGVPSETIQLFLNMPPDTPFSVVESHGTKISEHAETLRNKYVDEEGTSIITKIVTSLNAGFVYVRFKLQPPEERTVDVSSQTLANEWREMVGTIPGAESLTINSRLRFAGPPIYLELSSDDFIALDKAANAVKQNLEGRPNVFDIWSNFSSGKTSISLDLKPLASFLGLSLRDIMTQVRHAVYGLQSQRIQRSGDELRVMIRLPATERNAIQSMQELQIVTEEGERIPLSELADIKFTASPLTISRTDGQRTYKLWADVDDEQVDMIALQKELRDYLTTLQVKYPGLTFKMRGDAETTAQTLGFMFWSVLGVCIAIYILLGVMMNSFIMPFTVILSVPFCVMGAVWGHIILGANLSTLSLLGMLALVGIVMNDSLVVVDRIRKNKSAGSSSVEHIIQASVSRFRAVLLTSVTTFVGLLPMILEQSTQAQFLIPIAVSLGFGVLFATPVTLILTPIFYQVMDRVRVLVEEQVDIETATSSKLLS